MFKKFATSRSKGVTIIFFSEISNFIKMAAIVKEIVIALQICAKQLNKSTIKLQSRLLLCGVG